MPDVSFRCWCCKDSAIIAGYLLTRYNLRQQFSPSDPAFLCQREGCDANTDTVTNSQGHDVEVKRFADYAVSRGISPDLCQWIHEKELEQAKAAKADEKRLEQARSIAGLNQKLSMQTHS